MKSRKQNPVLSKMKRPQLVLKLLAMALMLQCILGLHTGHLPHEDNEYDVISAFHGLSGIQCSLKCTTSSEKCDAIASEAEGGNTGSCKLLKLASAIVIPLAPPNRLEKGKTKGKITVLKPKMTLIPVAGVWGDWSTWTLSSDAIDPCNDVVMKERTRACDSPAPLNSGPFCVGENTESATVGPLDCVPGNEADQFCQSQSMSLATIPDTAADRQALADTLPVPNVWYWFQFTDVTPPSGYTSVIKSYTGTGPYSFSDSKNSNLRPAACE